MDLFALFLPTNHKLTSEDYHTPAGAWLMRAHNLHVLAVLPALIGLVYVVPQLRHFRCE
ncbi:hypothetical protein DPMN_184076 [Dreissena polymorpha]|uniref:Uncharacterized protein n=1 Tax=Dreissena polymorpha TaxID=45954 RepID=A0A9D4I621_DREPO|nr:hypothetical protein DPMN_184076 [Dreissena polymorpha]